MAAFKTDSPSFQATIRVINQIAVDKFPVLVTRILQKLHLRAGRYFSEEEEELLKTLLPPLLSASSSTEDSTDAHSKSISITTSNSSNGSQTESLRLVLGCISYIYEQAAFTSTGPEPLYQLLLAAGMSDAHSKVQLISLCTCITSSLFMACAHNNTTTTTGAWQNMGFGSKQLRR